MQFQVTISPQFDFCYALADLASPNPHFAGWQGIGRDSEWVRRARSFGWVFWLAVPDLLEMDGPAPTVGEFIHALRSVPPEDIVPRIRRTLIEQPSARFPGARVREWLHFLGLDEGSPDPSWSERWNGPLDAPIEVLEWFRPTFEKVWDAVQPSLKASSDHARSLVESGDLEALSQQLDLGVEFDRQLTVMRTARGFKLPLGDIAVARLLPSIFNSRRFKTVWEYARPRALYLPYLLEDARLPGTLRRTADFGFDVDPWRVCRALGNETRAAILRLIAQRPRPAFELQQELDISKANISHHIFELREAGLITERRVGRTVELSVRLQALRGLTRGLTRELGPRSNG